METKLCFNDVVLSSASEIFETMMFMSVRSGQDDECIISGDELLGTITFKGEKIQGALFINCAAQDCHKIAAAMLGLDDPTQVSDTETNDALGEICNMVMGSIKARIIGEYGDFHVSIPSVVSGQSLESSLSENSEKYTVKTIVDETFGLVFSLYYKLV